MKIAKHGTLFQQLFCPSVRKKKNVYVIKINSENLGRKAENFQNVWKNALLISQSFFAVVDFLQQAD